MSIIKLYKQIRFTVKYIIQILFGFFIGLFIWRDKKIILIGNSPVPVFQSKRKQDQFLHNTKYMFLYANAVDSKIKFIYLSDDEEMINKLKQKGLNHVYAGKSLIGKYYTLRAKYWLTNYDKSAVANIIFSYGAKTIGFWHGAGGLKKVGYDAIRDEIGKIGFTRKVLFSLFEKTSYYVVNSEYEANCRKSAYAASDNQIKIIGSPRCDALYNDIKNADLFMEEDFAKIKSYKEQGKKLFFYTPTWRDTGKDVSSWLKSDKLKQFLKKNNAILVCKLHPADKNSLNFELTEEFYKMDSNSDIYPVLKYSDALITDYSSIYFDYLHLNKPIIYYIPDLEEYEAQCRGFYRSYETLTAGEYTRTEDEIINAMQNVIKGADSYGDKRKALLDEMFVYQDGHNCERIIEWIKSLN